MSFSHGGDVESLRQEYEGEILDFSANLNPFGMPFLAKQAATASIWEESGYPDPLCRRLTNAIAGHERVNETQVLCGNGAADLIIRAVQAIRPQKALLLSPCFSEYEQALHTQGCEILFEPLREEENFVPTQRILQRLTPDIELFFLCSPNNPTGACVADDLLNQIIGRCEENQIFLVLDSCFAEFLPQPPRGVADSQYLMVLKAFTKFYGMAGLRLGYALSRNESLLSNMSDCAQPWSVSAPAQAAGIAALGEKKFARKTRLLIEQERVFLQQGLIRLGAKGYPSCANYLLFRARPKLAQALRGHGILLRDCSNYRGLSEGYYRIAVRSRKENQALLTALSKVWEG